MSDLRVVQIINSFGSHRGGAERLARDLHVDLCTAGVDAHLIGLEPSQTDGLVNAVSLDLRSPRDPRAFFRLRRVLQSLEHPRRVIHAHLFPTSGWVSLLRRTGALTDTTAFTEHSTSNGRRDSRLGAFLDKYLYSDLDRILCISEGTKHALVRARPALADRAQVVVNGATLRFNTPPGRSRSNPIEILSVGRLTAQKNYPNILRALAGLDPESYVYTVLGGGAQLGMLTDLADDLGVSVRFRGHVNEPAPYLTQADIFVIASLEEGFGLAAVEAMNAGLPLVASDVEGLREVTGPDGQCAYLVDPDRPETIRAGIERLIADPVRASEMGLTGHARARRFDRKVMAQNYIASYRELLAAG